MSVISVREQQELVILEAIEREPTTIGDLWRKLTAAHFEIDFRNTAEFVRDLAANKFATLTELGGDTLGSIVVARTPLTGERLSVLRVLALNVIEGEQNQPHTVSVTACGADDKAEVLQFVRKHERAIRAVLASQPPAAIDENDEWEEDEDEEPHTMFCVTGVAVDAWWQSLPVEVKADVMVTYYESRALADELAPELTAAGRAAAEGK